MQTIRGVYDGKTIRPLPTETLPPVEGEVPVEIVFLESGIGVDAVSQGRAEAARRLIAASQRAVPLGATPKELIEDGRYR